MPFSLVAHSRLASLLLAASLLLGISLATPKTASAFELGYGQPGVRASSSVVSNRTGLRRQTSPNNRLEIPVFRSKTASVNNYARNNPVLYVDPTGLSAWTSEDGRILTMPDDGDTSVYKTWEGDNQTHVVKIGELRPPSETLSSSPRSRGRQVGLEKSLAQTRETTFSRYHGPEVTEDIVRGATVEHQEKGLLDAMSHAGGRQYDFKGDPDLFHVEAGVLTGDQFGNYVAGYSTKAAYGALGELGTRLAGHAYALRDHQVFDDRGSVEMIDLGVSQASSYDPSDNICR